MKAKRMAVVGEAVEVSFKSNPLPLGQQPYFLTRAGEEVDVPVGSTIHFQKGFAVRIHNPHSHTGGYGHPHENFWTVLVDKRNGEIGLLLPEGIEGDIHRDPEFILLSLIRSGLAEVKALPST